MDLYANKKIKITKNALTGEELVILTNKHLNNDSILGKNNGSKIVFSGRKFYSTK